MNNTENLKKRIEETRKALADLEGELLLTEDRGMPIEELAKLPVDTLLLVRSKGRTEWLPRYLLSVENGLIFVWNAGRTSKTAEGLADPCVFMEAKIHPENREVLEWIPNTGVRPTLKANTPILIKFKMLGDEGFNYTVCRNESYIWSLGVRNEIQAYAILQE